MPADDADRFASAFVPSWQLEDAPFSAGPAMSPRDLEELGAISGVASDRTVVDQAPAPGPAPSPLGLRPAQEDFTTADVDVSSLDPARAAAQPAAGAQGRARTLMYGSDPFAKTVDAVPPPAQAAPGTLPSQGAFPVPVHQAAPAPVAARNGGASAVVAPAFPLPSPARWSPDDDVDVPIKKSNKGLLLAGIAVAAVAAAFLGFKILKSEPPADAAVPVAQTTTARATEENKIPPPPPPAETAVAAAPDPVPQKPVAAAQPPAPPPPVAVDPPRPPPPPPPRPVAAAPQPRPPRPPAPPKNPPKAPSGGIVRDNPF